MKAENIVQMDPAADLDLINVSELKPKGLDSRSLGQLLRAVHKYGSIRDIAIVELLAGTGLRVSELLRLSFGDIEIGEGDKVNQLETQELEKRNAQIMALFKGSLIISAPLTQNEVQQSILDLLEELYELSLSFIMLYDGDRDVLETTAYEGEKGDALPGILQRSDSIAELVFAGKQTLITNDIESDERISFKDQLLAASVKSILCVPLVSRGSAIGLLGLCLPYKEDMRVLEDTGRLITTFAGQAAIAIENTRLYEELEDANEQIIEWNEFLQQRVDETTEKLIASRGRLWHAERLSTVGQLVAGFIHEINNPLYAISNYAQKLVELELDSTKLKYLEAIAGGVNVIKGITENLSELTRLSSLSRDANDINQLLTDAIALIEFDAQEQGVSIKQQLDADLPSVKCDSVKIRQVFLNLLINALDAMPEGGTITVKTDVSPLYVSIVFEDTGAGIDEDGQPHIFEPFFSTKGSDGIGLGLFVSKSIIEAHDGRITFETQKGVGTCFEVRLPLED
jgi:signal transduction histidine kinase